MNAGMAFLIHNKENYNEVKEKIKKLINVKNNDADYIYDASVVEFREDYYLIIDGHTSILNNEEGEFTDRLAKFICPEYIEDNTNCKTCNTLLSIYKACKGDYSLLRNQYTDEGYEALKLCFEDIKNNLNYIKNLNYIRKEIYTGTIYADINELFKLAILFNVDINEEFLKSLSDDIFKATTEKTDVNEVKFIETLYQVKPFSFDEDCEEDDFNYEEDEEFETDFDKYSGVSFIIHDRDLFNTNKDKVIEVLNEYNEENKFHNDVFNKALTIEYNNELYLLLTGGDFNTTYEAEDLFEELAALMCPEYIKDTELTQKEQEKLYQYYMFDKDIDPSILDRKYLYWGLLYLPRDNEFGEFDEFEVYDSFLCKMFNVEDKPELLASLINNINAAVETNTSNEEIKIIETLIDNTTEE